MASQVLVASDPQGRLPDEVDESDVLQDKVEPSSIHVETPPSPYQMNEDISADDAEFLTNYGEERRKKTIRKIDMRLIPLLTVLYLVSFLDRANIGNAKIEGMATDLKLSGYEYNIALSIFFITYILCELPSNAILARTSRPSIYIGVLVIGWGTVMTLTGIVKNFAGLVVARIFLGFFEAGFFPGAVYLISTWYLPNETQFRISMFYCASALSGAFSGLLAYAIVKMDGIAGVAGWRWIFIIEGIASVATGIICLFCLADCPDLSHRWLEPDEIRYLELRQLAQHGNTRRARAAEHHRRWQILKDVLLDWQLYLQAIVYWGMTAPNYGLKFSMPAIIKSMGFTSAKAQLLTIPPYTVGAIAALVSGVYSDRLRWRMPFISAALVLAIIAFAILFAKSTDVANNLGVCYFGLCLACAGLYPITPGANAWTVGNLAGPTKRAQGTAWMLALGNLGGIYGSFMYLDREAPRYPTGYGMSFGFTFLAIVSACILEFLFWKINKKRSQMSEAEVYAKYSQEELDRMGDRSPLFRYTL